jgi:CHAT domain-containing protein
LLQLLADEFNKGRDGLPVKVEYSGGYSDIFRKAIDLLVEMDEIRRSLESAAWQDFSETRDNSQTSEITNDAISQNTEEQILRWENKDYELKGICAELSIHDREKTDLIMGRPFSVKDFQETLDDETFILEMFQTDEVLFLMCITNEGVIQYLPIDISLQESIEIVAYINNAIGQTSNLNVRSHDFIKDVLHPLRDIYQHVFEPMAEWFRLFKRCIIIPHGLWHYLPFHALYVQEEKVFLCDKIEVGYCPSAAVLQQCRMKKRLHRENAILMSQNDGNLPLADDEVQRISRVFKTGNSMIFTGQDAHLGRIENYPADIIHLACHGWFVSEEPLLSGIAIKPAEDEQRRTYALDLFNMHIPCTQITVSACETGLSLATKADELMGLSRGLFSGGAAALMLSLWKVADESTCQLMENYYTNYVHNRQTKTRALQLAMQTLKTQPKYAHPFFWAPFVVMGEWG